MICSKQETQYTIEWLPSVPSSVPSRQRNKVWLCQWNLQCEMNGIFCNSILRGLDGIKRTSFNLPYFQAKVARGPIKKCTNTIKGAVLSLPCDHFLNTLSTDDDTWFIQNPQHKTFVVSISPTTKILQDRFDSGPRDMPFWPCRPHDTFQLQRLHCQLYVGSNATVLRCIIKSVSPAPFFQVKWWYGACTMVLVVLETVVLVLFFFVSPNPLDLNKLILGHCSQNHHHIWSRFNHPKDLYLVGGPKNPVWKFSLAASPSHNLLLQDFGNCLSQVPAVLFQGRVKGRHGAPHWSAAACCCRHFNKKSGTGTQNRKEEWKGSGRWHGNLTAIWQRSDSSNSGCFVFTNSKETVQCTKVRGTTTRSWNVPTQRQSWAA